MRGNPTAGTAPTPRRWVFTTRTARLVAHVARGIATAALVFPWIEHEHRARRIQRWSKRLLSILGVHIVVRGDVPRKGAALIVANHVSWIDVFVILATCPVRFVGKSEIRSWILIGWLTERAGTLFIARGRRRDAGRVSATVAKLLAAGDRFAVFPEGSTTQGDRLLPFHGSLIQPAVVTGVPVVPAAIRYQRPGGALCTEAAYDADRTIIDTLRETSAYDRIHVSLEFADAIDSAGRDRRSIAHEAQSVIAAILGLPVPGNAPGRSSGHRVAAH